MTKISVFEIQALLNILAECKECVPETPEDQELHEQIAAAIESLRKKLEAA